MAVAENLAVDERKRVQVLLSAMTAFADALKEVSIAMDQVPANRGYPGDLYSQLATVKDFLGLSYERAYKRFYPAVDPLLSWSRYLAQLSSWFEKNVAPGWVDRVLAMLDLLRRGNDVAQMMQVTGEEGVSLEDHLVHQKSLFLDMVYLQQDAFDQFDASAPLPRQKRTFDLRRPGRLRRRAPIGILLWILQGVNGHVAVTLRYSGHITVQGRSIHLELRRNVNTRT